MIYDKYVGMIRGKLESANKIYTQLAYKKVGELSDIGCFETKKKLHSAVPQQLQLQIIQAAIARLPQEGLCQIHRQLRPARF